MIRFRLQHHDFRVERWTLEVHAVHDEWVPLRHFSNAAEGIRITAELNAVGKSAEACND